ncbi:hypothetical protein K443DRAFT_664971, partial [Laccaria amethystina LaAM-08-1]
ALPVRVEPKGSFDNESTSLSRLHFSVIVGGTAVGLLNLGDKSHVFLNWTVPIYSIFSFVGPNPLLAMAIMIYTLHTYLWRANSIRHGGRDPYDDSFGPTVLCISLLGAWYPRS